MCFNCVLILVFFSPPPPKKKMTMAQLHHLEIGIDALVKLTFSEAIIASKVLKL